MENRTSMKKMYVAIALLAVVAASALGAIYYVAGTPQYSLYLLRKAVREKDYDTFTEHFDVHAVVLHAVERAVGGVAAGPRIVSQKANDVLIPASDKLIRQRLDDQLNQPDAVPALGMEIDSVRYTQFAAYVTLKDPKDGSTTTITMERLPNRQWKVIDVDLGKLGVQYSLEEARQRAEELVPPEMPKTVTPSVPIPSMPMP